MLSRVRTRFTGGGSLRAWMANVLAATAAIGLLAALAGCGSGLRDGAAEDARADVDPAAPGGCASTVLEALGHVAVRVYDEGVSSERTASALHMIASSRALRTAVEAGDARGTLAAERALLATGHMTNLRVTHAGKVLAEAGRAGALAPLRGTLRDSAGTPIGSFVTSVWANGGLIAETNGIAEGMTILRAGERTVAGALQLPPGKLPARGTLTRAGVAYQYTSFPATSYPSGGALRVYLLRSIASTASLCGASDEDTLVNTLSRIAHLIYDAEAGPRTLVQVQRVQHDKPLLSAVAQRDPAATRRAVQALLHQHIVRLRVSADGRVLSDVGGPLVLAPGRARLRRGGRTIGSLVLSIQDDEGYTRLAQRLVGLDVLMYSGSRLVKSTLGALPRTVPTSGVLRLRGRSFRPYTFSAAAFPSGALRITVLIPVPYS